MQEQRRPLSLNKSHTADLGDDEELLMAHDAICFASAKDLEVDFATIGMWKDQSKLSFSSDSLEVDIKTNVTCAKGSSICHVT